MISKGKAFISIKRDIEVEWIEGINEEILAELLMRAVHIAQQEAKYDAE